MKKTWYKIILGTFLTAMTVGCTEFVKIEPIEQIPDEFVLTSGKNVESVLMTAYSNLTSGNFLGERVQVYSELIGDNIGLSEIAFSETDFTGQVAFRNSNILNKDIDNLWQTAYRAIAASNAVIDAVDKKKMTDNTPLASQNRWKAEALYIRAVAHFELMRLFSQPYSNGSGTNLGIPLRIKYLAKDEELPRATINEVVNQVIADLQAALTGLPTGFNGNRATQWAAKAHLVRVYFDKRDYANSLSMANDIITNGSFNLSGAKYSSFRNVGNGSPSSGVVWQLVVGGNPFGSFRPVSNRYSINQAVGALKTALDESGATDYRAGSNGVANLGGRFFSNKWNTDNANIPLVRYAEILLSRAEAAAQQNDLVKAAEAYNLVRGFNVAGFTNVTFTTQVLALEAIRKERRIEMMFEGDRYHELRRLQVTSMSEVKSGATVIRPAVPYNGNKLLLKIPVSETSGNKDLVQNPD